MSSDAPEASSATSNATETPTATDTATLPTPDVPAQQTTPADRPADFDAVVAEAVKSPISVGSAVYCNYRGDPEEGWFAGRVVSTTPPENDGTDGGDLTYDVLYQDGDMEKGVLRKNIIRAHPWTLRRFVMAIRSPQKDYFLRGQIGIRDGMLEDELHRWLYTWKTCQGGEDDQLKFTVMYCDFLAEDAADRYTFEDILLPDPNVIMLDLVSDEPPKDDVEDSKLQDWWTRSPACRRALDAIVAQQKERVTLVNDYQGPAIRGLSNQIVWAQEEKFAYWPGLVLDPVKTPTPEWSRWLAKSQAAQKKAILHATKAVESMRFGGGSKRGLKPVQTDDDGNNLRLSSDVLQVLNTKQNDLALVYWLVDKRYGPVPVSHIFGWTKEAEARLKQGYNGGVRFSAGGPSPTKKSPSKRRRSSLECALARRKPRPSSSSADSSAKRSAASTECVDGNTTSKRRTVAKLTAATPSVGTTVPQWTKDRGTRPWSLDATAATNISGLHPNKFEDLVYGGTGKSKHGKKVQILLEQAIDLANECYRDSNTRKFLLEQVWDDLAQNFYPEAVADLLEACREAFAERELRREEQERIKRDCHRCLRSIIKRVEQAERQKRAVERAEARRLRGELAEERRRRRIQRREQRNSVRQPRQSNDSKNGVKQLTSSRLDRLMKSLAHFRKKHPPKWHKVRRNKYPDKSWKKSIPKDEVPECTCEDDCGEGCWNRELYCVSPRMRAARRWLCWCGSRSSQLFCHLYVEQECVPGYCPTVKKRMRQPTEAAAALHVSINHNPRRRVRSRSPPSYTAPCDKVEAARAEDSVTKRAKRNSGPDPSICCANTRIQREDYPEIEVFRTLNRGWGLRTTTRLPAGAMVCEYLGEVIDADECAQRMRHKAEMYTGPGCAVCGGHHAADKVLLCDGPGCGKEYHMFCLKPKLTKPPEGVWIGPCCSSDGSDNNRSPSSSPRPKVDLPSSVSPEKAAPAPSGVKPEPQHDDIKHDASNTENRDDDVKPLETSQEEHPFDVYFANLEGPMVIDAEHHGGIARFANHCCWPNCIMQVCGRVGCVKCCI